MRNYPNREHTLALLGEWQKHHAAVTKMMDIIKVAFGSNTDGPIFDTVWRLFEAYTDAVATEVGDFDEWLPWFYNENDMGAKGMAAGYDGKRKPIKTLAHLYGLIAESRKRGA